VGGRRISVILWGSAELLRLCGGPQNFCDFVGVRRIAETLWGSAEFLRLCGGPQNF
jgi:hypothetical protein